MILHNGPATSHCCDVIDTSTGYNGEYLAMGLSSHDMVLDFKSWVEPNAITYYFD